MNAKDIGPIEKLVLERKSDASSAPTEHLYLDVENKRLVATDSHSLIVIAVNPEPGDVSGLISVEALRHARAAQTRGINGLSEFSCGENELVVTEHSSGKKTSYRRPQGQFPKWENLFPKDVEETPILTINPQTLQKLVAAFPKNELGRDVPTISFFLPKDFRSDQTRPIIMKACSTGAIALMMTVKYEPKAGWDLTLPGTGEEIKALPAAPADAVVPAPKKTPKAVRGEKRKSNGVAPAENVA